MDDIDSKNILELLIIFTVVMMVITLYLATGVFTQISELTRYFVQTFLHVVIGRNAENRTVFLVFLVRWIRPKSDWDDLLNFVNWYLHDNTEGTLFQRRIKCKLEPFLTIYKEGYGNVKFVDESKKTMLHYCTEYMKNSTTVSKTDKFHDKILVRSLCWLGASIIAVDCDGNSPLGLALMKKRMDLVDVMLRETRSVTKINSLAQTSLHILIDKYKSSTNFDKNYYKLIRYLISKGADLNKADKFGIRPVHLAAKSMDIKLLKMLELNGAYLYFDTNIGDDLLILVCKNIVKHTNERKLLNSIDWLSDEGLNADIKNKNNFTPLHYVSQSKNLSIIKIFVASGTDIHAVANDNTNLLHSAAMSSNFEVMQYFVKSGVDHNRRDNIYGFTLIHMAALSHKTNNFEWLVKQGLDPNDCGHYDLTPLHLAAMVGNIEVVKILIQLGADVHYKEQTCGCTALHLASMAGDFETFIQQVNATRLYGKQVDENSSLISHCLNGLRLKTRSIVNYTDIIMTLLETGVNVNVTDNYGRTPLHYATRSNRNLTEILLKVGAYIDIEDTEGYTPLHNCLLNANVKGLESLLFFGADINDIEHPREDIYEKIRIFENTTNHYVLKHLVKLKLAGLHINDIYTEYLTYFEMEDYNTKCLHELMKLKDQVLESGVSLYDLLSVNFHLKHRAVLANSLTSDLQRKFPNYYILIKGKCNKAVNQASFMESIKNAYRSLTGFYWPDLCIEHILSFLDKNTSRVLIESVK